MSREAETTQRPSADGGTPFSLFYRYPLLLRGLCWISSIGVISSGMVWAQTEPTANTVVVPASKEPTQPIQAEPAPVVIPKPSAPEVSVREVPERSPTVAVESQRSVSQSQRTTSVAPKPSLLQTKPAVLELRRSAAPRERETFVAPKPSLLQTKPAVQESKRSTVQPKPVISQSETPAVTESKRSAPEPETVSKQPILNPPNVVVPTIPEVVTPPNVIHHPTEDNSEVSLDNPIPKVPSQKTPTRSVLIKPSIDCNQVLQNDRQLSGRVCGTSSVRRQLGRTPVSPLPSPHLGRISNPQIAKVKTQPIPLISNKRINLDLNRMRANSIPVSNRRDRIRVAQVSTAPRNRVYYKPRIDRPITTNTTAVNTPRSLAYYTAAIPSFAFPGNSNISFMFPLTVPAPITSAFGWRIHPISGNRRLHAGTDIGAPMGTPVIAAATGQVMSAEWMGGYGKTVVIQHNQIEKTLYAHLSEILVEPGQWVEQGTVIGQVGSTGNSTGPHLHFETRQLTSEGWVAIDSGVQLEFALNHLVNALQTAQSVTQPGS